jgi:hypothetical protein
MALQALQQQMIVVAHKTVCVNFNAMARHRFDDAVKKELSIAILAKDDGTRGTTIHHVMPRVFEIFALGTRHWVDRKVSDTWV